MSQLTGETVQKIAREIFHYEISQHDALSVANTAGAMLTLSGQFSVFPLSAIGPAFGYPNLNAEAAFLNRKKA
jgi:hypothetical protein